MRTDAQLATAQLQIRNTTRPRSTSKRTGGNLGLWAAAAAKAAQGEVREKLAPYSSAPPRTGSTPLPTLSDLMRPPIASQSTSSLPSSSARTSEPAQTTRVQPSIGPAVTSVPSATSPPILDHTRLHSVTERASTAETSKGALFPTTDNAAGIEEEQEETTEMADNEEAQQSEQELKEERAAEDEKDEEEQLFLPSDIARRLAALKHTRIRQSSLQAWQMESKGTSKSVPIRRSGSTMMLSSPSLPKDWKRSYKVLRLGLEKEEVVLEGKLASVKSRTADRDGVMEDISTVPANPSSQGSIPTKMNDAHTQSSPSREVQNGHEYEYARARGIEDVDEARHPLPASRSTRAVHSHRTHSITITDLVLRPSHFPFLISHEEYQQQAVHLRPQQLAPPLVSLKLVLAQLQRRPHRALVLQTPPPSVRPLLHSHLNTSRTLAFEYAHAKNPSSTSPVDPSSSAKQAHPQKHSVSQQAPATSNPSNTDCAQISSKKQQTSTPSPNSNNAAHHGTPSSKSFPSPASATVFVEGGAWSPLTNVEATGVTTEVVESMDKALKQDILKEAAMRNGQVLLHDEVEGKSGNPEVIPIWETVGENDGLTPREVYELVISEEYRVDYARLAITDEQAHIPDVFSHLENRVQLALDTGVACVFNFQMGRGRTTTGMIISCLVSTVTWYGTAILRTSSIPDDDPTSTAADTNTNNSNVRDMIMDRDDQVYLAGEYRVIV
ncbi:hypothetical protein CF326_g3818 [Tilletia indica]|nr:hypothetical protein CF326_g3818 [Tilletia indica]